MKIKIKIETEDIVFGTLALVSLLIWFLTLLKFDAPLMSIIFLWSAMILISILYIYFYKKSKRNMKILRIRFLISGIPIYPMMIYYIYKLVFDNGLSENLQFLPFYILLPALALNGIVLYVYEIKKTN